LSSAERDCASSGRGSIARDTFGTVDGVPIEIYTLSRPGGLTARIMTYGGTLVSLHVPDREGRPADVVLGFDTLTPYVADHPYFGALIGRFGNRIARGRFEVGGASFAVACNDPPNHLHGGRRGFDKVVWEATPGPDSDEPELGLTCLSENGDEGYPGNLDVVVSYRLTADNALQIDYRATTDRDTVVNLTNHSSFNLAGAGDVLSHEIMISAGRFLPVDAHLIPTGEWRPVAGTPMDLTRPTPIGAHVRADDRQLRVAAGYDHNWVLDKEAGTFGPAAEVHDPGSGRLMEVLTSQPGVQFYTGNLLDGTLIGKGGRSYRKHDGFCLETQHFPDSPNQPDFPSTVLRPGETYRHSTAYRFSVR
jgi:aldose 1-epimerase